MAQSGLLLVLHDQAETIEALLEPLRAEGFEIHSATQPAQAIQLLKSRRFDVLMAGGGFQKPSALAFLAKARELLPLVLRVYLEPGSPETDLRALINRAAPAAIFADSIPPETLGELIRGHKALLARLSAPAPAPAGDKDTLQLKSRLKHLERENARLKKQGRAQPDPTPQVQSVQFRRDEPKPLAKTPREPAPTPAQPDPQAVMGQVGESRARPLPAAEGALQLDIRAEDDIEELARLLALLLEKPDIQLPALPALASKVQQLTASDLSSFEEISQTVALDPSMSARILEVANSPLYAGTEQVRSLQNAVSRIGMQETRNILLAVCSEGVFKMDNKELTALLDRLWMHSLAVAYSNEIIAKQLYIAESDDFFMMGLLHDIGKLLILTLAAQGSKMKLWHKDFVNQDNLLEAFRRYHIDAGLRLMDRWEYPESFRAVVGLHNDDARVFEYEEPVVVTYYSNLLTRKLDFSLEPHVEEIYNNHQIAQALNMDDDTRGEIEKQVAETVHKISESYR